MKIAWCISDANSPNVLDTSHWTALCVCTLKSTVHSNSLSEMAYTVGEFADMVYVYEQENVNSRETERLYRRRHSTHTMFPRLFQRLRETVQLEPQYQDRGGGRTERTPDMKEAMLDRVAKELSISNISCTWNGCLTQYSLERNTRKTAAPRLPQNVHALTPAYFAPRVVFSLNSHSWTDESPPHYNCQLSDLLWTRGRA